MQRHCGHFTKFHSAYQSCLWVICFAIQYFHKNHPKVREVEYLCSSGINVIARNVIWQAMHKPSSVKQALQCEITLKILLFVCLCYKQQSCIFLYVYEWAHSCVKVNLRVQYASLKFCVCATWCVECKTLKLNSCCVIAFLALKKVLHCYTCVVAFGAIVLFILYVFLSFYMSSSPTQTCGLKYWTIKIKKNAYILL